MDSLGGILAVSTGIAMAVLGIPLGNTIPLVAGVVISVIGVSWIVHDSK